uniref:Uncharacterized protein n=1 Tax=Rhizophora mucronata TaxID=61149 RepID=A0A2P2PFC6_RHIMU
MQTCCCTGIVSLTREPNDKDLDTFWRFRIESSSFRSRI